MPDLSAVLNGAVPPVFTFTKTPGWRDVLAAFRQGAVPHSWAVRAPLSWHKALLTEMSKLYLCDEGTGCGECGGCRGWIRGGEGKDNANANGNENSFGEHPDRMVVGEFEKAGNIDACRSMIRELSLKPVAAKRRLGVILAADKLLVHAANSLLKVAEEPPSHACLLFLLEGSDFLPTLRSRSRFTTFAAPLSLEARPMPEKEGEWAEWLEALKDDADMPALLSAWGSSLLREGRLGLAARVEGLRLLVLQKKLSQAMVCDLLILTLKEDLPFELVSGGFW